MSFFQNKIVLAPMVRVSTIPFRLLALEYGADLVYSEEIIDYKMINCKRIKNDVLNTIDFCIEGVQKPVFRTNEFEKEKVIFQLGTCNAQRALQVCKLIENDVCAIDLNMGCPKEFSIQGGMGAALLKKPELVKDIVTTLVNGCKIPITCKIRILPSIEQTIELCKMIEECGAKAITIHGRFQEERPRHKNHNDYIKEIASHLKVPVIANGGSNEIKNYDDICKFRDDCGVSSVMVARAAMWNCSVFRKEGLLPLDVVIKRYLEICMDTDNFFFNTKYAVQQMLHEELTGERGLKLLSSEMGEEIYVLFDMLEVYKNWKIDYTARLNKYIIEKFTDESKNGSNIKNKNIDDTNDDVCQSEKRLKIDTEEMKLICLPAKFISREYENPSMTPKSVLNKYSVQNKYPKPIYRTEEKLPERVYHSVLEFQGVKYASPQWESKKQTTEQAAAMVCLKSLGLFNNKE